MARQAKQFKTMYAGRELIVETGKTSELANGSCSVSYTHLDVYKRQDFNVCAH